MTRFDVEEKKADSDIREFIAELLEARFDQRVDQDMECTEHMGQ